MKTDVLIVGAGPAGSCTAAEISEAGIDVLALDRREEIGYPIQCGEFLPVPDEMRKILPESEDYGDLFELDPDVVEKQTRGIEIHGPREIRFEFEFHGVTLNRRSFDKSLWRRAEKEGARLSSGVEFLGLRDSYHAQTSSGEIEFKVLVGADGPLSRTRASLGLKRPRALSQAITTHAEGEWDDRVRMYFGSIAPGGYAWIIPKSRGANVGLGVQKEYADQPLIKVLNRFLETHGIEKGELAYGQVPVSGPIRKTVMGNALLVGDSAGQVMATNGGGIPIAMICGRIAGRAVVRHLRHGGQLSDYEREWRRQLQKPLKNASRAKALADIMFKSDGRLRFAMKLLGSNGLERAILCKKVFGIL